MKSGLTIRGVLALSPELWVGCQTDYNEAFHRAFKATVEVFAFDPMTRARWFPISYLHAVKSIIREYKVSSDKAVEDAHLVIQAETARRTFLKVNTNIDGSMNPKLLEAYATLGLHPSAPRTLIEWAIMFWRREAAQLACPQTQLMKAEEAYRIVCGG